MPEIIKVTNPEAQELIRKIQTGEILIPIKEKLAKYRWHLVISSLAVVTVISILIGISLGKNTVAPYIPDNEPIGTPTPTTAMTSTEKIKRDLNDINLYLPDPELPVFDLRIDLRTTYED